MIPGRLTFSPAANKVAHAYPNDRAGSFNHGVPTGNASRTAAAIIVIPIGLGILATANLNSDQTIEGIRKIRALTPKPFGANVPLMLPGAEKKAEILFG